MAYNTKPIVTDKDGNPISQYYNPDTDQYEPVEGAQGANKVLVMNNDLSLIPILEKLNQLVGTVIDEETRKSNELERIDNEGTRKSNEDIRNTNEITRVEDEEIRIQNENTRIQNEDIRQTNEQDRVNLYNDLIDKVNSGYFDGKNLEFHWNGTSLGVRVEGETDYVYVDLKGDTGDIDNLTMQHVINALGYTPANEDDLDNKVDNSRVLTDVPANAKFTDTTYDKLSEFTNDVGFITESQVPDGMKVHGNEYHSEDYATQQAFDEHKAEIATQNELGHIKLSDIPTPTKASIGLGNVDNLKQMPISGGVLENYREKLVTLSGTTTAINLNLGNVFTHTLSGNTTYSITNAISGQAHSFTLIVTQTATVRTITFPASVKWQGGEIPDMSETNKTYVLTFLSINGGTTWLGMFGGEF